MAATDIGPRVRQPVGVRNARFSGEERIRRKGLPKPDKYGLEADKQGGTVGRSRFCPVPLEAPTDREVSFPLMLYVLLMRLIPAGAAVIFGASAVSLTHVAGEIATTAPTSVVAPLAAQATFSDRPVDPETTRNTVAQAVAEELQGVKVAEQVKLRVAEVSRSGTLYNRAADVTDDADLNVAARQREWENKDHTIVSGTPRAYGLEQVLKQGWGLDQWACLDRLWFLESNWNYKSGNKSSGAYGIPQALPATKMATEGEDWKTNPMTQIRWGIRYIDRRYGSPCKALDFWSSNNWY